MAKSHVIPITNGKGSLELDNGTYNVSATVAGYDVSTIDPPLQEITEGLDSYNFTISATGTLTLHVTDDGTEVGIPVVGATFVRCDAEGVTYGTEITTDDEGNEIFNNVPFSALGDAPNIYYKQTASDGEHTFNSDLQTVTLEAETHTIEVENAMAAVREFSLTDANYEGLPIEDGSITLEL